jgi:hypothetical protein
MKNNKKFSHSKTNLEKQHEDVLILRDSAIALNYGRLKNDQRLQITMPSNIVEIIDRLFPNEERNKIFTKAIIAFLSREMQISCKFSQKDLLQEEQIDMDEMWNYLDQLDGGKI